MKLKSLALFGAITLFATLGITAQTFAQSSMYAPAVSYGASGQNSYSVAVSDVNGDGKPDLLVTNLCASSSNCDNGTVDVLLGNGDGTFQAPLTFRSGGALAESIAVADVNGDGNPDLLLADGCVGLPNNCTSGGVSVLLGNGDGTFKAAISYSSGGLFGNSVAVSDVNGDGKPDLLVANQCASNSNCANGTVGVLLGNGDGTFQTAVSYASGTQNAHSVKAADVNGDGKPDLLVANYCAFSGNCEGTVGVLLGNGDGTFAAVVVYESGGERAYSVAVEDVNGDGKPDLLVANFCADGTSNCGNAGSVSTGSVGVLLGDGDGTFEAAMPFGSSGYGAFSVAVSDVNGDGKPDLLVTNLCASSSNCDNGTVGVLLGNGDGTFQTPVTYSSGGGPATSVAASDVNGDDKPDLLVANQCGSSSNCRINSNGSVGVLLYGSDNISPTTVATASPGPNINGWNSTSVTVSLNATDNPGGSRVKQIQFSLSGVENTGLQTVAGNTASVTISVQGITVLTYFATDNAGNVETAKMVTVQIDQTPPVITGLPTPGCTIWPPNHKLVQVATVTATDALSGLVPASFEVTGTSNGPAHGQFVITGGPSQFLVQLGADKGQVYRLTATVSDLAGNTATLTATCTVPHDQGH